MSWHGRPLLPFPRSTGVFTTTSQEQLLRKLSPSISEAVGSGFRCPSLPCGVAVARFLSDLGKLLTKMCWQMLNAQVL